MSDMTVRPLQVGEHVKYVRKVVESEGESVRIGQTGEVVNVRDNTKAADEFGSVLVFVVMDETVLGDDDHIGLFRPEELERFHPEPFDLDDFVDAVTGAPATEVLAPTTAPQDHGPLAAPLSDRTLDKVLSRPTRVFGFNVVTISPQGIPGGPRLDGVVSRQRAQDELDELEPFMVDGWKTVMVELREVTS